MKIMSCLLSIISLIFISPAFAQLKDILDEEYERVEIINTSRAPQSYQYITRHLPLNVFPMLPPSYRWEKKENEYVVMKHRAAPLHRLEFAVFTDNLISPSKVNYLTLIDNINVQSFSYTRPQGKTFGGNRDPYPFTVAETLPPLAPPLYSLRNQVYLRPYVDGHCIDHADTIHPEVLNYHHSSTDPRNHIPEAHNSYWGLHIRNPLVASIREQGGCYMQLPYYSLNSPKTNLGPLVPEGVYFTKFSRQVENYSLFIAPQETCHIPWNDPIHGAIQAQPWNTLLEQKKVPLVSHGYLPYIANLTGSEQLWWQQSLYGLLQHSPIVNGNCQIYDVRLAENLKMAADLETEAISYKLRHLSYSYTHAANTRSSDLSYWHGRALHQADLLFEFQKPPFSPSQLEEAKTIMRFADEEQQDYWRQVIASQEELSVKGTTHTLSPARKPYNLRSAKQLEINNILQHQEHLNYHIVEFHTGKGSETQIKKQPPVSVQDINRTRKIWIKEANSKKIKAWLQTNDESFRALDKSQIEIYYKPSTTSAKALGNIDSALRRAGFKRIFRKWE